jgi:hypothetical protein
MEKRLGLFDILKVSKSQKHAKKMQKQANCFVLLKPNERVLFRKSLESMEKKPRSL